MIPGLSETTIHSLASEQSYARGDDYYASGAVSALIRRGNTVTAEVEGSSWEPYHVQIDVDEAGITAAHCDCPYDYGGWCKHIVAVALTMLNSPETVAERAPLVDMLSGLDRDQMAALLLKLASGNPAVADAIDREIVLTQSTDQHVSPSSAPAKRRTKVDDQPFRDQVSAALHSLDRMRPSQAYWHVGEVIDSVRSVVGQAEGFLANNDPDNALVILEATTDEYVNSWYNLDGSDGTTGEFFYELGEVWTEALLSARLTEDARQHWVSKLEAWASEVDDYGIYDAFDTALGMVAQPGQSLDKFVADGASAELAPIILRILAQRGDHERFLRVARQSGQTLAYTQILVQLNRIPEATAYALDRLHTPEDALALAKTLREQGALDEAIQIAEHGLAGEGNKASLAIWLRDLAAGLGNQEMALRAAILAFHERPDLNSYGKVQSLAGNTWPQLRLELLEYLRTRDPNLWHGEPVDVFLHEGLVDDAIKVVEKGYAGYDLLARVVEAATAARPDWAIKQSHAQAMNIINPGKANRYHHAINWLQRMRDAYRADGREAGWQDFVDELRSGPHGRKYKLMGMLDEIV